jgi:hypothetical protein
MGASSDQSIAAGTLEEAGLVRDTGRGYLPGMPPRKQTEPFLPLALVWKASRLSDDGRALRLLYPTGPGAGADRADILWGEGRYLVTLMRMGRADTKLSLVWHCVELALSRDARGLNLFDGATGGRAENKSHDGLDPDRLRSEEQTLDDMFEPREFLTPTDHFEPR